MITLKHNGKVLSFKAERRIEAVLAAIEQANTHVEWDNYEARIIVRRFYGGIFRSKKKVFVDIIEAGNRREEPSDRITIPAFVTNGKEHDVHAVGRRKWYIQFPDLKSKKCFWQKHVRIKMKGE